MHDVSTGAVLVTLTIPATLPLPLVQHLEQERLQPHVLFDVTLTPEAIELHGLTRDEVFVFDLPWVEVEDYDAGDQPPESPARPRLRMVRDDAG